MISLIEIVDFIDKEIAMVSGSAPLTQLGESAIAGAVTALKNVRAYLHKNTQLGDQVQSDPQAEQDQNTNPPDSV